MNLLYEKKIVYYFNILYIMGNRERSHLTDFIIKCI